MATCGNHGAGKRQSLPLDVEPTRTSETTMAEKDIHAKVRKALHRIVSAEVSPQAPQTFHHGAEIDLQVTSVMHPIPTRISRVSPGSGAAQQRLTRDTAVIETVPPHEMPFDQRHACPQAGSTSRGNETGRAGTDDHQIIGIAGDWIVPIARMRLRQQTGIVRIVRKDLDSTDCGMRDNGHTPLLRRGSLMAPGVWKSLASHHAVP